MEDNNLNTKTPAIKQAWLRILLFVLAFLFVYLLAQGFSLFLASKIFNFDLMKYAEQSDNFNQLHIKSFVEFIVLGFIMLLIFVFRKFIDRKSFVSMGYSIKGKFIDIIMGTVVGFILISLGFFILKLTGHLRVESIIFNANVVVYSFIFFLFAAIIEEVVFRGYILNNLLSSMKNNYLALAISSVLFALIHGLNPNLSILSMVNLFIAGLALGITYIHTQNLWFPIFLHVSWNYFQGPIFGFEVSGMDASSIISQKVTGSDIITGGEFGFEGSIILSFLLFGMIFITDNLYRKKHNK